MKKVKESECQMLEAKKVVKEWRAGRTNRSRVPEWLWDKALALREDFSVHAIAKNLQLRHEGLQKREQMRKEQEAGGCETEFIECEIGGESRVHHECILEIKDGAISIHCKSLDVAGLSVLVGELVKVLR